jgi:hypothetical protein
LNCTLRWFWPVIEVNAKNTACLGGDISAGLRRGS